MSQSTPKKPLATNTVRRRIHVLKARINDMKLGLYERTKLVEQEIRKIRERCPHDWKYHPDPAGDSGYDECTVCGESK